MTKVKICGITSIEDALAACAAGADALGFVFAPEAKRRNRYVEPEAARAIIAQLPPFVASVAVCVDAPRERILEYLEFADYVQLCGNETAEDCRAAGRHAIKAFRTCAGFDPRSMLAYPAAAFLLDAALPGMHGGSGTACDWDIAREAAGLGVPLILAGGLTPDNVADAVRAVRPYAVDASSGLESAPGKKDHARMRSFVANAKLCLS